VRIDQLVSWSFAIHKTEIYYCAVICRLQYNVYLPAENMPETLEIVVPPEEKLDEGTEFFL